VCYLYSRRVHVTPHYHNTAHMYTQVVRLYTQHHYARNYRCTPMWSNVVPTQAHTCVHLSTKEYKRIHKHNSIHTCACVVPMWHVPAPPPHRYAYVNPLVFGVRLYSVDNLCGGVVGVCGAKGAGGFMHYLNFRGRRT